MNFNQLVIREYLKHNPILQDSPEVHVINRGNGVMRWQNTQAANMYGTAPFSYEIPDIGLMFSGLTVTLPVWKPTTHRDIAKVLFGTYGVVANIDDITPTPVSFNPLPDYVDLVAVPEATSLTGKLRVALLPAMQSIDDLIAIKEVDAVIDELPLVAETMRAAKKYYGYDFTDVRTGMAKYKPGVAPVDPLIKDTDGVMRVPVNLLAVRAEMDSPTWERGGGTMFDESKLVVEYNGLTDSYPTSNPEYSNVLVFNKTGTGSEMGKFLLHYNM